MKEPVVLTIQIDKIRPGLYNTTVLAGGVEVTQTSQYASIEEAIREVATDVPEGFAHFADVIYLGASSGTISLASLSERASQVADQLVAIVAEMYRVSES